MSRYAESYPCPFCTHTAEKRKTAQVHFVEEHLPKLVEQLKRKARRSKKQLPLAE